MSREVLERVGSVRQVAGIQSYQLGTGPAKGVTVHAVHNRAGLAFTLVADKALDVFDLTYRGMNLAFQTRNGLVHPARSSAVEDDFFSSWGGGMLATCGLANIGDSCEDDGFHPIHGRIGNLPAESVGTSERWQDGDLVLEVRGTIRETRLYGRHLVLQRCVRTTLDSRTIEIEDVVSNQAAHPEPVYLLYHVNLGHPLLAEGGEVLTNAAECEGPEPGVVTAPSPTASNTTTSYRGGPRRGAAVFAGAGGVLGVGLEWDRSALPRFFQWRCLRPGDYVIGLEPATAGLGGRTVERLREPPAVVDPYGELTFGLTLTVLDGTQQIQEFCRRTGVRRIRTEGGTGDR